MPPKILIAAPFSGTIALQVSVGDDVEAGQILATIEAMKMEINITAPQRGRIAELHVSHFAPVVTGEPVCLLEDLS